jgi:phage major head subunit gpT-like protein
MKTLKELRELHVKLQSDARAQFDLIKDDTPADKAREIEVAHDALLKQADEVRGQIEKIERDEAEAAARAMETRTADDRARKGASEAGTRAERERQTEIRSIGTKLKLDQRFVDEYCGKDTSVEDFRKAAIDKFAAAPANQHPGGTGQRAEIVGQEDGERRAAAMEVALLHRFDPASYRKEFEANPQAREYRGMSLVEMCREALEGIGVRTRGMSKLDIAQAALSMRSYGGELTMRAGGMMATGDFSNVLANVANKTLRQAYSAAPQTFKPLVRIVTVPDFKQVSRVQLGEAPQLELVNEHGEFKRGKMSDTSEKYSVATYGKVVAITRQVLVNDDLDAFTRIPMAFGRQAANLESDTVWAIITANAAMADGVALFHATHKNLGTAGAISVATVGAGRVAMATQTGLDGVSLLNLDPTYLVVPKALETTAEQFRGQLYPATTGNIVPDSLKRLGIIAEPRLDAASTSNWYLAADPGQIDTIELAYLEGSEGVYTETRLGFDVDGMEVKVRLDLGAKAIDFRGLYKNPN